MYVVGTYDGQTTPGKKSTYVLLKGQKQIVQCLYLPEKDSSPLTPGPFDAVNPDARILTPDPPPDP